MQDRRMLFDGRTFHQMLSFLMATNRSPTYLMEPRIFAGTIYCNHKSCVHSCSYHSFPICHTLQHRPIQNDSIMSSSDRKTKANTATDLGQLWQTNHGCYMIMTLRQTQWQTLVKFSEQRPMIRIRDKTHNEVRNT